MNQAPNVSLRGTSLHIGNGMRGIFQTLHIMRDIVRRYKIDPVIRQAAVATIFLTPEKNGASEVEAIFNFVRDHIRYLSDISGVETLATPDKTLLCRIGDCDDQTVLLAAMLESIGHATRFVAAGYIADDAVEHVYLQVLIDGEWVDADPTEHFPLGYAPPLPAVLYVERV